LEQTQAMQIVRSLRLLDCLVVYYVPRIINYSTICYVVLHDDHCPSFLINRKIVAALLENVSDHQYHPPRNWTIAASKHLNRSAGVEGVVSSAMLSRPVSFLSHPLPECSCRTPKSPAVQPVKDRNGRLLFGGEEECPEWMARHLAMASAKNNSEPQNEDCEDELPEDDSGPDTQQEPDRGDVNKSSEQDEEMDPDD
jgi:hypothetical protein